MSKLRKWVSKAIQTLVDPDQEARVADLVTVMHRGLQQFGQKFSLASVIQGLEFTDRDLEIAKDQLYRKILAKGWEDEKLTEEEQHVAKWVAEALEIPTEESRKINLEIAREYFSTALAQAMEDGILDKQEEVRLLAIATSVGMSLPEFVREFFQVAGERFLRAIFMVCIADGHLSTQEWAYLLATTKKFGIRHDELLRVIQPQAKQFVEHVLADAKADGRLSAEELATLNWLAKNLGLPPDFLEYLRKEVSLLQSLTNIADGVLPNIPVPAGVAIRAGEIVHFHSTAIWREVRMLKNGPKVVDHRGNLTLTDNRLLFASPSKSHSIGYRRIVSHSGSDDRIEAQVTSKPRTTYFLPGQSPIPYAIFNSAVAMANQTLTGKTNGSSTRHIPRDVRQRVWQRYSGRCAECGATDYLEFDHVIPVAKGGSNSDNNIQLLCRRCNLKKSDRI